MKPALFALSMIATIAACDQGAVLLHNCEDLDAVVIGSKPVRHDTKTLHTGGPHVSEGRGSLRLYMESPPNPTGSVYLNWTMPIPETDLTRHAFAFDGWTSFPDNTRAIYVRTYDTAGRCSGSWRSWNGLLQPGKKTFVCILGQTHEGLEWEKGYNTPGNPAATARVQFHIGTRAGSAPFDMFLDNIRAWPAEVACEGAAAGAAETGERFRRVETLKGNPAGQSTAAESDPEPPPPIEVRGAENLGGVRANIASSFREVTKPKPLYPDTWLVAGGRPRAVIVAPAGEPWAPLAVEIAGAIRQATGAELPVILAGETSDERMQETNAIVMGSILDNPRLLYPYTHKLVFTDANFPGPDGFDLRTVHDPWGAGTNLLCLGATTVKGARAGVDALRAHIAEGSDLILPRMLDVKLTGPALAAYGRIFREAPDERWETEQKKRCENHLQTAGTRGLFSMAAGIGKSYAVTRQPAYARMFVWMIQRTHENYLSDPKTYGGPWGMDSDFHIHEVIPAWDAVEQCDELSDDERLEIARILFRWVSEVGPRKAASPASKRVRFNHQTFPALGCLFAGQYYSRYYDAAEGHEWIRVADGTFQFQLDAFKPHCDCNSYQWLTLRHVIDYCRARPDLKYFENDHIRRNADYAILTMNNLGYQVAYGDIGNWGPMGAEMPILRAAEWHYRDGRAQWALNKKHAVGAPAAFSDFAVNTAVESEPSDLVGTKLWPLDALWHDTFSGNDAVPLGQAVDKISFRNGFAPEDQYLLLGGLSLGGHSHMDGNSVLQWSENGRVWLCDGDYIKSLPKHHNGVLILRDGQSAKIPGFCELENLADLPSAGFSRTVKRGYAGVDWHRNLIWLKDRLFLCIDQMEAKESANYSFRAVWQTIGDVALDGAKMSVEQQGQHAAVAMSQDTRSLLNNDPELGNNWRRYPFAAEPVVRVYQGIVDADLQEGEQANLFTALHASGEAPSQLSLTRLNDNVAHIQGVGGPILVAVADRHGAVTLPGVLSAKARMLVMTPEKLFGAGVTEFEFQGQKHRFAQQTDFEADLASGQATLLTPSATSATAAPEISTAAFPVTGDPGEIRGIMQAVVAAATPPAPAGTAPTDTPRMEELFFYAARPESYLLTNNATRPERVPAMDRVACEPAPMETNIFSGAPGDNQLGNLFDGGISSAGDATMWDDDREVAIDIRLQNACRIDRMTLAAWFVTSSSKGKRFQIGRLRLLGSDDGFVADTRTLLDFSDTRTHDNWGGPANEPHRYAFDGIAATARDLRLIVTPREDAGVYIAELELWGGGEGLDRLRAAADPAGAVVPTFRSVHCADLDRDGIDETIAGCDKGAIHCLQADGTVRWIFDAGGAVNSVHTVDFQGDGWLAVIAGTMNSQVLAIDAAGRELWRHDVEFYKRAPYVRTVFPADLTGDGRQSVIAGSDNWRYHALDATGKKLWHQESVHGATAGCAIDLTGGGRQEIVCGTEYYWWPAARPGDGERLWGYRTASGPGCNAVAGGDIDGDGANEIVFGGADTLLQAVSNQGKLLWTFNTGDEVTSVSCADVTGDGKAEIVATSLSFHVYCVGGDGKLVWRTGLPNQIRCSVLFGNGDARRVAAGCDDGKVYLLDASDGRVLAVFPAGARPVAIAAGRRSADTDGMQIVVSCEDGTIRAIRPE